MSDSQRAPLPPCREQELHPEHIRQARERMPDTRRLCDLSEVFRVFGDASRIRILYALFESELCVCDLSTLLGMTQSAVSHQLRILKDAKLVRFRREGKSVIYALDDDHVRAILSMGMEHLLHS